jgi:ParB family chromosome partitioning protein
MAGSSKRRLGRGLDGLLPASPDGTQEKPQASGAAEVPIEELHPNRAQPRRSFDEAALDELAQSIQEHGILEPILVRKRQSGGYTIVAGERRWRAAQRAGLKQLPVFVRELSEGAAFEAALVENLQREDLNPIETSRAFQRLMEEHGHTQETVAARVGKDRSTVANALRLLKLPDDVLGLIEEGRLSEGHGRALLGAPDSDTMRKLARTASRKHFSVREVERRVRSSAKAAKQPAAAGKSDSTRGKSANLRDLERRLSHALGTTVTVEAKKDGSGQVIVQYASYEQLDDLMAKLGVRPS